MMCVAIALSTHAPAARAQVVVENGAQTYSGTGSFDLTLTVGANGTANFSNAIWLIGTIPGVPRIDVLNAGAVVQTDSVIQLAPGAQIAVNVGGLYTVSGASAILSPTNDVSDVRVTTNGVFDISGVTTALPLSSRIDLPDPVNVPANAGVAIGSLAGSGTVNMTDRVLITGFDNTDSAFSGTVIQGTTGRFIKNGAGTLTIDGAQFQGGEVYVGDGAMAQTSGDTGISYLSLGIGSGVQGELDVSGGTLTIGTGLHVGDFGGTGLVEQTGGDVVLLPLCGNPASCVSLNIGNQGGNGTYRLSGGNLNLSDGFMILGRNTGTNPASTGVLDISGSGHVTLGSGATLILGNNGAASNVASGTINQTGGTLTVDNAASFNLSGSGTGTYNLNGGTLQIGGSSLINNYLNLGGSYALNLGGGTVQAYGSALTSNANATLSNTSTLDTNGLGITWNGALSGAGALNKVGTGTLTLTGQNTYHGPTLIADGTLAVTGASGLYMDYVFDNARLTNNGVLDISAVATALPLTSRVDLPDPVNVPINAGVAIGSLAGSGTVNLTDRVLATGFDNTDSAFSGTTVQGTTGRFIKIGTGTLTIDGAQFQGGEVYVGDGAMAQTSGNTGISYLSLGIGSGAEGDLDVSGGTLTIGTGLHVGDFGGSSVVNQTGGDVVLLPLCGDPASCVSLNIGNQGGNGTYRLSGGNLDFSDGFVILGRNTGTNPGSTGVLDISGSGHATLGSGTTLVLGNNNAASNIGSGTINQTGGTLTVDNAAAFNLSGSGTGTYNLTGGTLQIGGSSLISNYLNLGGSYALNLGGGTVQAYGSALTANADATLSNTSTLDTNGLGITWNGTLSGNGALNKAGAGTLNLTASNTYAGGTHVLAGTLAVVRNDVLGSGTVTLSDGAVVSVTPAAGDFTFNNALASATPGAGLFSVTLADPANNFAFTNVSGQYQGTVQLGTGSFALTGINTAALATDTLQLDAGSRTTVGGGSQAMGGLVINGGFIDFPGAALRSPTSVLAGSSISTGRLTLFGGQIAIDYAAGNLQVQPQPTRDSSLLSQDDDIQLQLISSSTPVNGSASSLSLVDRNTQQPLGAPLVTDVIENGNVVAVANYDFIFNTADDEGRYGLFVGYGLRQLALQGGQTLTLYPTPGGTGMDTDLAALLTGTGNVAIAATPGVVSLSNPGNDYTGQTLVINGSLRLGNDRVLGLTSLLDIAGGAGVDLNGHVQAVGKLIAHPGSRLDLNGTLTISDAQRDAGDPSGGSLDASTLFGTGTLNIDPSIVEVNGANPGYSGDVVLSDGSQLILDDPQGVGSAGTLTLSGADDVLSFGDVAAAPGVLPAGTFAKQLAGLGTVELLSGASIALGADDSAFAGVFDINAGATLAASQANQLGGASIIDDGTLQLTVASDWSLATAVTGSGLLVKLGAGTLGVDQALAGFGGLARIDAGTLQLAAGGVVAGDVDIATGATLSGLDGASVGGSVDNAGTVRANAGNFSVGALNNAGTVVLAGPRVGNVLTVNGDYQGQGGTLQINSVLAADDAPTDRLIVLGNTSGATALQVHGMAGGSQGTVEGIRVVRVDGQSGGVFTLQGRAVGGAFEYGLFQGSVSDPGDGDWYLRTEAIRPEVGAYLGNQYAAVTMLRQTMRDRTGEPAFIDVGEDNRVAAWARFQGQQIQSGVGVDALQQDLRVETNLLQLGVELLRTLGPSGRWQAGLMGAHGETTTDSTSAPLALTSRGRVTGDAIGAYATWFSDAAAATGFYADVWAQYASFDNKIRSPGLPQEKYDADSWTTSAEIGYAFDIHHGATSTLYLEPQVQALYTDYSADDHVEQNGTDVSSGSSGGLATRVGLRLHGRADSTQWSRVQPFAEVNWWNNGRDNEVVFDGRRIQQQVPDDVYEARAGFEVELGDRWSGSLSLGLQHGSEDYRNVIGALNLRAAW